ncbi:MAG: glycine--tRNA ligase subunit beta [Deltaproteobacteria bacterium]|nr:glycine--tRNA ligase subunit beta [Deltaproteobacteria bacterium]
MSKDLLLEIGTEEIPSDYLENGLRELKQIAESRLKENGIPQTGDIMTSGTPRRLVLVVEGLPEKQEDMIQEITGPPKRAAYDKDGNPTNAALGFARKNLISVEDLQCIETPKGEYLHVRRKILGKPSADVLSSIMPAIISEIPWPKSMRWGDIGFPFVRPIHWILALLGDMVLPFDLAGVKSGNRTMGHRFMSPKSMEVVGVDDYFKKMKENFIIVDIQQRASEVERCVTDEAAKVSGIVVRDPELLTTVTNLVEYPSAVCGNFDVSFLDLPDPVLITVMKKHQKYFAVRDQDGRLMPNFVAVNNTLASDVSIVRKGHEKVLRARLSDAAFFFQEDRKIRLQDRLEGLKNVIYQDKLGSSYAKIDRFTALAHHLAVKIAPERCEHVRLAARLCKCDLITEMVTEFPTLQGVMGEEYSRLDGHPEEVCTAIREHYLPARADDELPDSIIGAIVGLADRMDTISGCFAIGQEPSGAADPFALRRHALAIIRILENIGCYISLKDLISESLDILRRGIEFDGEKIYQKVLSFFRERYKNMMLRSGYESDLIEAVISADFDNIDQLRSRIDHLKRFSLESSEFESLALTFKRVSNILKNQAESPPVDPLLFIDDSETGLWNAYQNIRSDVYKLIEERRYFEALNLMAGLRKSVDNFFDSVEVLTKENARLKENRVGILQNLSRFFLNLADFSCFSI